MDKNLLNDPNPTGMCLCGCGKETNIAKNHNYQTGMRKGGHYKYIAGHRAALQQGKRDRFGYTQSERTRRNDAIWHHLYHLIPFRPMKKMEVYALTLPRWPEKTKWAISRIIGASDVINPHIILESIPIKHCKWCGKDIYLRHGNYKHCSPECEKADKDKRKREHRRKMTIQKSPILQPVSLLCRDFHSHEHDCLSHLAFDIVKTDTDAYNPSLVASAWIGIQEAWDAGERNRPDLEAAAQAAIKKFRKEDRLTWLSIDAMKESHAYEPHIIGYESEA